MSCVLYTKKEPRSPAGKRELVGWLKKMLRKETSKTWQVNNFKQTLIWHCERPLSLLSAVVDALWGLIKCLSHFLIQSTLKLGKSVLREAAIWKRDTGYVSGVGVGVTGLILLPKRWSCIMMATRARVCWSVANYLCCCLLIHFISIFTLIIVT